MKQRDHDLRVGIAIAVVIDGEVFKAKILRGGGSVKIYYRLTTGDFYVSHVMRSSEGLNWSRDWNRKSTDALRVSVALSSR